MDLKPITRQCEEKIIQEVNKIYGNIPLGLGRLAPSAPDFLKRFPLCARELTLQQLIDLLEQARREGRVR